MATHIQVAHAWAHQTGKARNGFNMYYEGTTIYSYGSHFPIARHVGDVKGRHVVTFNSKGYSTSTAKHKTVTHRAIPNNWFIVSTPAVMSNDWQAAYELQIESAKSSADTAARARKYGDSHLESARRSLIHANDINDMFDLGHAVVTLETMGVAIAAIEEKARVQREADRARDEERQKIYQERLARERVENFANRVKWQLGELATWYGTDDNGRALLRVRGDKLETSQGVDVPLTQAIEVFKRMRAVRERGETIQLAPLNLRIGDYRVDCIDADGTLHAGCHTIGLSEGERIAALIGLELAA